ncbi:LysR family transcriptional regulator [Acinetobacter lactucae]|uniref:LysR family transcriptional regulator n=1 Tax=Acinetobacter lactucae TaxID=1785128 RepID=UPI0021CDE1B9|nr:LysR family transcriptional regulator [Acinetobacter lactucae]MCU4347715.1 LysR family transcriptional regulator [Acinetobacter lactucae]
MDLSLIRIFIAIYENCNISKAAEVLNLSQPTVTYNLNLMREKIKNPLFERTQYGVKPTNIAHQLYPTFKKSISEIEYAIAETQNFNPLSAKNTFKIALSDIGEMAILPALASYLFTNSPNIKISIQEVRSDLVEKLLIEGLLDVAIFNSLNINYEKLQYKSLLHQDYVCLVNKNHPLIKDQLTLKNYLEADHISINSSTGHNLVDQTLRNLGYKRNIKLIVPHFSVLRQVLNSTSYLATLPSLAAKEYLHDPNLRMFKLPFEIAGFYVGMHWFDHHEDPIAHEWLLKTCEKVITNI